MKTCMKTCKKIVKKGKTKRCKKKPITQKNKKRRIMRGGVNDEDECSICFEPLNNQQENIYLKCRHLFHKNCMYNTCMTSLHTRKCKCPLCRRELDKQELDELGMQMPQYSPPPPPSVRTFQNEMVPLSLHNLQVPSLHNLEEFKNFMNVKLRAPTGNPLIALNNTLEEFLGTDSVPLELMSYEIMVFELEQIRGSRLQRYKFLGIFNPNTDRIDRSIRKYFRFIFSEVEGEEDVVEDIEEI
jgi:hypothetical protein